jgi:hypothetical protein
MYKKFLAKVKATSTGKQLETLPRNDIETKLCSGQFNMAFCQDPECKLPTPSNRIFATNASRFKHI